MEAFENYFKKADLNQDGKISGSEAVAFFQGFGLPKQVLSQIWSNADQTKSGFLGRPEFFNALRLVTVAQSGRNLTPEIVKSTLYGPAASKIPPPQIKSAGSAPSSSPQISFAQLDPLWTTQVATSGGTNANQVQQTQAQPSNAAGVPGSGQPQPQWPKMTKSDVNTYTKVFHEVDKDGDGRITGMEARNLFLSWKLPREILKQVWDLSDQDSDGMLTLREFCIALYLMERHRQGSILPKSLPDSLRYDEALLQAAGLPTSAYAGPTWQQNPGSEESFESNSRMESFETYFEKADLNQDGKISRSEAVAFFQGSGLPEQVLAQIWSYVHQKKSDFLGRPEFFNALRLITVAQSGRSLTPEIVKSALYGPAYSKIPPPEIKSAGPTPAPQVIPTPSAVPQGANPALPKSSQMGALTPTQYMGAWPPQEQIKRDIADLADEDLQKAIKASIQTAIKEGIHVFQPGDSFKGPSSPTVLNPVPTLSTTLAPSAPPLDSLSNESFCSQPHVNNFSATGHGSSETEAWHDNNVNLGMCSICIDESVEGACIPCGHMAGCMGCLQKIKDSVGECPICRAKIACIVKLYSI